MPDAAFVPVQPPDAIQDVAFVDDQVNTDVPPLAIEDGLALKVRVGNGGVVTLTIADFVVVPPAPVQAKV